MILLDTIRSLRLQLLSKGMRFVFGVCLLFISLFTYGEIISAEVTPVENKTKPPATTPPAKTEPKKAAPVPKKEEPAPSKFLLKESSTLKDWIFYSADKNADRDRIWGSHINGDPNEPVLVCLGKPSGYLRSKKTYKDFEFGFEWKFPKVPNGNSGILVHTTGEDKIWPKAIQIQLHGVKTGSIFPSSGAKTENTVTIKDQKLDHAKWNRCTIISKDGKVTVSINGKKQGEVTGCTPNSGTIALQSEGAEIHFRKIWIRDSTPASTPAVEAKPKTEVAPPKITPPKTVEK